MTVTIWCCILLSRRELNRLGTLDTVSAIPGQPRSQPPLSWIRGSTPRYPLSLPWAMRACCRLQCLTASNPHLTQCLNRCFSVLTTRIMHTGIILQSTAGQTSPTALRRHLGIDGMKFGRRSKLRSVSEMLISGLGLVRHASTGRDSAPSDFQRSSASNYDPPSPSMPQTSMLSIIPPLRYLYHSDKRLESSEGGCPFMCFVLVLDTIFSLFSSFYICLVQLDTFNRHNPATHPALLCLGHHHRPRSINVPRLRSRSVASLSVTLSLNP